MKLIDGTNRTILISRTDSIGDVILTLPLCVWLKEQYPSCRIVFMGNTYTKPVIECLAAVDQVLEYNTLQQLSSSQLTDSLRSLNIDICIHVFPKKEIAKQVKAAGIPVRIGTSHRLFHLFTCNYRLNFTRKHSEFHESQLNFELLKPFGLQNLPSLERITTYMNTFKPKDVLLPSELEPYFTDSAIKKIILHPKSQGSALEWPMEKYSGLSLLLAEQGHKIFFTGTEKEGALFREMIPHHPNIIDTTGKLSLVQLISMIGKCDALIACSTGPLHIAGISGLRTVGIYSQVRPIHPGRWKPIGKDVRIIVNEKENASGKITPEYISAIPVEAVYKALS